MDSLSNFAESLILGEVEGRSKGKSTLGPQPAPGMVDISETSIPADMLRQVLGEEAIPEEPVEAVEEEEVEEVVEESTQATLLTEETAQEMVALLSEVRDLLQEMSCGTGVGSLGVNMGGAESKPKKKKASSKAREYLARRRTR